MNPLEILKDASINTATKLARLMAHAEVTPHEILRECERLYTYNSRPLFVAEIKGYLAKGCFPIKYYSVLLKMLKFPPQSKEDEELVALIEQGNKKEGNILDDKYFAYLRSLEDKDKRPNSGHGGTWLRVAMAIASVNIDQLAAATDTYPKVIQAIIDGRAYPSAELVDKINNYFGFTERENLAFRHRVNADSKYFKARGGLEAVFAEEVGGINSKSEFLRLLSYIYNTYHEYYKLSEISQFHEDDTISGVVTRALSRAKKHDAVNHAYRQRGVVVLEKLAMVISSDAKKREKYPWVEEILLDVGYKRLPRPQLDYLVREFFTKKYAPTSETIQFAQDRILVATREVAREFTDYLRLKWNLSNNTQLMEVMGLGDLTSAVAGFLKLGTETFGISTKRMATIKNPDGTVLDPFARNELQALVNGNPTIPLMAKIVDEARFLMAGMMRGAKLPEDNFVLSTMRVLHAKYPEGNFLDKKGQPNINRIPNTVLNLMMERYGFEKRAEFPMSYRDMPSILRGERNVCVFPESNGRKEAPYTALAFASPFKHDEKLYRNFALLLLMIPHARTNEQLMDDCIRGGISLGRLQKIIRLQEFKDLKDYATAVLASKLDGSKDPRDVKNLGNNLSRMEGYDKCTNIESHAAALARRWFPPETTNGAGVKLRDRAKKLLMGVKVNAGEEAITVQNLKDYVTDSKMDMDKSWGGFISLFMRYSECGSYKALEEKSNGLINAARASNWVEGQPLFSVDGDTPILQWITKVMNVKRDVAFARGLKALAFDKRVTVSQDAWKILDAYPVFEIEPEDAKDMLYNLRCAANLTKNEVRIALEINSDQYSLMERTGVVCVYSSGSDGGVRVQKSETCIQRLAKLYIHEGYECYETIRQNFILAQTEMLAKCLKGVERL